MSTTASIVAQPAVGKLITPLLSDIAAALTVVGGKLAGAAANGGGGGGKPTAAASRDQKYWERAMVMADDGLKGNVAVNNNAGGRGGGRGRGAAPPPAPPPAELSPQQLLMLQRETIRGIFIAMPDGIMADECFGKIIPAYEQLLQTELQYRKVVKPEDLVVGEVAAEKLSDEPSSTSASAIRRAILASKKIIVWQGDMSILAADAVVNPANNALLGCFLPSHKCLDNILHGAAGPRLRLACRQLLDSNKMPHDTNGQCRVTDAYCMPSKYVFHTVGPDLGMGWGKPPRLPNPTDRAELRSCYTQCLSQALAMQLKSIAFCCISTGIFAYPADEAAALALDEVLSLLAGHVQQQMMKSASAANTAEEGGTKDTTTTTTACTTTPSSPSASLQSAIDALPIVIFNVFKDEDLAIYTELLADE